MLICEQKWKDSSHWILKKRLKDIAQLKRAAYLPPIGTFSSRLLTTGARGRLAGGSGVSGLGLTDSAPAASTEENLPSASA